MQSPPLWRRSISGSPVLPRLTLWRENLVERAAGYSNSHRPGCGRKLPSDRGREVPLNQRVCGVFLGWRVNASQTQGQWDLRNKPSKPELMPIENCFLTSSQPFKVHRQPIGVLSPWLECKRSYGTVCLDIAWIYWDSSQKCIIRFDCLNRNCCRPTKKATE